MQINTNFQNIADSYLFSTINKKVAAFTAANPDAKIIKMGIGDVTRPLCKEVIAAMHSAVDEMGRSDSFHGYGPEQGYDFLKQSIRKYYSDHGVSLELDEIFISDGAKSDLGNILDLFDKSNTVLVPDPVYPVYVDTNVMSGRKINYINATAENGFLPLPEKDTEADIIYICSPNNPTGAVYNKEQLKAWVDFALSKNAVILFDSAYEAFVTGDLPHSIYQVEGADKCAVEFCSFSKTAGFTGTRCGYTVVPSALCFNGVSLNKMWLRRQTTKFNGVPYIVQKGAEAVFTENGWREIQENLNYYRENSRLISETMDELGVPYTGGKNSPYIWHKCPGNLKSWEYFDLLLEKANVVGTPGSGFGENGEGFFRLTAFSTHENTAEAMRRVKALFAEMNW